MKDGVTYVEALNQVLVALPAVVGGTQGTVINALGFRTIIVSMYQVARHCSLTSQHRTFRCRCRI